MTQEEFKVLETIFLILIGTFVVLALPGYALMRQRRLKNELKSGEEAAPSVIQPLDLLVVGFYILVFAGLMKGAEMKVEDTSEMELSASKIMAGSSMWLMLAGLVPAVIFWRGKVGEFFGLRWRHWPHIFWIMPAFVFSMIFIAYGLGALGWQDWVKEQFASKPQAAVQLVRETQDIALLVALAIGAVLIAPIAEEVIFRGYLYPVVEKYTDRWFAAGFTGILFGVIHANLMSLPVLCVIGIVLAVLYERTKSLWVVIGCHAAFNGFQVGLMLLLRILPAPPAS